MALFFFSLTWSFSTWNCDWNTKAKLTSNRSFPLSVNLTIWDLEVNHATLASANISWDWHRYKKTGYFWLLGLWRLCDVASGRWFWCQLGKNWHRSQEKFLISCWNQSCCWQYQLRAFTRLANTDARLDNGSQVSKCMFTDARTTDGHRDNCGSGACWCAWCLNYKVWLWRLLWCLLLIQSCRNQFWRTGCCSNNRCWRDCWWSNNWSHGQLWGQSRNELRVCCHKLRLYGTGHDLEYIKVCVPWDWKAHRILAFL